MNTRVLGGWLSSKISAGQSGGVPLLWQLGPFHFSLILNVFIHSLLYFLIDLGFYWQYDLFIHSLNDLFLNFWYFFTHKFNWFCQSKILCVFECSFLFIYSACVSVTYLHFCFHIALYFVCPCCLFCLRLVYVCAYVGLYMCTSVCFCIYKIMWMSLYKLSND